MATPGQWDELFWFIYAIFTVPLLIIAIGLCWWIGPAWWVWIIAITVALIALPAWIFIGSRIEGFRRKWGDTDVTTTQYTDRE